MKSIRYTLSMAWKEIQLLFKDPGGLAVLFLLPLLLSSLTGGINLKLEGESTPSILLRVGLVNLDAGPYGSEIAKAVQGIDVLEVTAYDTAQEAEDTVAKGDLSAAIVIPDGFSQQIDAYIPTAVQVIVDPADPDGASIVSGIMNQVVAELTIWGEVGHGVKTILNESGLLASASVEAQRAVAAQNLGVIMTTLNEMRSNPPIVVAVENPQGGTQGNWVITYLAYVFPGFTVMFAFFVVGSAASSMLDERELGTLRRLQASTIPPAAIISGKILAFMCLVCAQVAVLLGVGHFLFSMPLGNQPLALIPVTIVLALTAAALGIFVAALSRSPKQATDMSMLLGFVLAALGGAIPLAGEPLGRSGGILSVLSKLTPHAHAVEAFYRLMGENASLAQVLPEVGILLAMGIGFGAIGVWRLKLD